jgi:hypothetical protein
MSANDENLGVRVYKGHEIEVDDDGHVTVWQLDGDGPGGDHWTEASVADARASIDKFDPITIFGIKAEEPWPLESFDEWSELTKERDGDRADAEAERHRRDQWGG